MTERHYLSIDGSAALLLCFAVALIVFLLLVVPVIQRRAERGAKRHANFRVISLVGRPWLGSGAISRIAVFDDFFLLIGFSCVMIKYEEMKNVRIEEKAVGRLNFRFGKIDICLYGDAVNLKLLSDRAFRKRPAAPPSIRT
jgi:hypothetical protein